MLRTLCRRVSPRISALARRRRRAGAVVSARCETTISNPKEASTKPALEQVHDQASGLGTDGLENEETWMQDQIMAYYRGKKKLAEMMGRDPATFSEEDVDEAIRYLLPTGITAKDARPMMKHPLKVFPKRKVSAFDSAGRPIEPGFYTGSPAYYNLIYEIYRCGKILEEAENGEWSIQPSSTDEADLVREEEEEDRREIELSDEHKEYTDKMEEVAKEELHLHELHEEDQEKMEDHADKLEEEEEEEEKVLVDNVSDEQAQEDRQPTVMKWLKKPAMANLLAEEISDQQYEELIRCLGQLADHEHSDLITEFLDTYRRPVFAYRSMAKLSEVNDDGYSYAIGRRKTSVAQVWVKEGEGNITVNGRSFNEYFPCLEQRQQVMYPFILLNRQGQYDVKVKVHGGGMTGQGGAVRLAISRALLAFSAEDGDILEKEGLLIRDPRMVERKKPGQKKARKKFTWVKR